MLEQYKILWDLLESELKRFWDGYRIFSILKVAILSGSLTYIKIYSTNDNSISKTSSSDLYFIWILMLFLLILLSLISILLNYRSRLVYSSIIGAIKKIEDTNNRIILTEYISQSAKNQGIHLSGNNPYAMDIANMLPIFILNISLISMYYISFILLSD